MDALDRQEFLKLSELVVLGGLAPWRDLVRKALVEHRALPDVPPAIDIAEHYDIIEADLSRVLVRINGKVIVGVWSAETTFMRPGTLVRDMEMVEHYIPEPVSNEARLYWAGTSSRLAADLHPYLASDGLLDIAISLPDTPDLTRGGRAVLTESKEKQNVILPKQLRWRPETIAAMRSLCFVEMVFRGIGSWTEGLRAE